VVIREIPAARASGSSRRSCSVSRIVPARLPRGAKICVRARGASISRRYTPMGSVMNYMNLMSQRGADSAPCNPIFIFTFGCVLARNGREDSYLPASTT